MIPNRDRADYVATFRFIEVFLMETTARWVPTTPELEAKVLFGRHVWEFAQIADALGRRTFELRAQMHLTLPPQPEVLDFLNSVASIPSTSERIAALYRVILPAMSERYRQYLSGVDPIMDEPTIRIMERILDGHQRMAREVEGVLDQTPGLRQGSDAFTSQLAAQEKALPRVLRGVRPAESKPVAVEAVS